MKAYFITENFQINTVWRYEQTCDHISVCSGSYAYSWIYNQPSSMMAVFCQLTLSIGNVSPRLRTWSVNVSDIDEGKGWFCWFVTPRRQPKFKIASMSLLCRDNGLCNHVSSCEYLCGPFLPGYYWLVSDSRPGAECRNTAHETTADDPMVIWDLQYISRIMQQFAPRWFCFG